MEGSGFPPAFAASSASALELLGPLVLRTVSTAPAVSARLRVIGRAASAVVTVGAGRDDGASSEVLCWRIRARFVPSLVFPLGTHPLLCGLVLLFDGLASRACCCPAAACCAAAAAEVGVCWSARESGEGWLRARGNAGRVFLPSLSDLPWRFCV